MSVHLRSIVIQCNFMQFYALKWVIWHLRCYECAPEIYNITIWDHLRSIIIHNNNTVLCFGFYIHFYIRLIHIFPECTEISLPVCVFFLSFPNKSIKTLKTRWIHTTAYFCMYTHNKTFICDIFIKKTSLPMLKLT